MLLFSLLFLLLRQDNSDLYTQTTTLFKSLDKDGDNLVTAMDI